MIPVKALCPHCQTASEKPTHTFLVCGLHLLSLFLHSLCLFISSVCSLPSTKQKPYSQDLKKICKNAVYLLHLLTYLPPEMVETSVADFNSGREISITEKTWQKSINEFSSFHNVNCNLCISTLWFHWWLIKKWRFWIKECACQYSYYRQRLLSILTPETSFREKLA